MSSVSAAYIHVPFCRHRCGYCDFTLVARRDDLIGDYLAALRQEMSGDLPTAELSTLFFGGGTPTHLSVEQLQELVGIVKERFSFTSDYEWSVEANPIDLILREKVAVLAEAGVNRVSLGVQSFDADALTLLERDHSPEMIDKAVAMIREFIPNVALDLIFGVPGQSLRSWEETLDAAIQLNPTHVSTYGLTFEKGTRFWSRRSHGELNQVPDDLERDMYATAMERLDAAGYRQYELSNFAKPGFECRHNIVYWNAEPYFAFGPGAARYLNGRREMNHRSVFTWLKRLESGESPIAEIEELSPEAKAREAIMLGLRQIDGIDLAEFELRTGFAFNSLVGDELDSQVEQGMVEMHDGRVRLTYEGRFLADSVIAAFL
ncbi:radical SAM family heme chaperone HemW [Calycomorphotria hydatis]|uniref:Heme chaperone HemW n=1 Tax=Calycomorphotria hydatis TaxID=2528027 RepID=A0A517TCS7_9PLAN|nr:radical SAM family heme chaperone HemW [Calycomorphotria hydatis]QDT66175.1 Oxygen-independent coproporphyrinogen-III oxidase-like protein [Calycomorphotria hydatis]